MEYNVRFQYFTGEKNTTITLCSVVMVGSGEPALLGEARQRVGDPYNKNLGRKYALTRAIRSLPRSERAKVWEWYHSTIRNSKKNN